MYLTLAHATPKDARLQVSQHNYNGSEAVDFSSAQWVPGADPDFNKGVLEWEEQYTGRATVTVAWQLWGMGAGEVNLEQLGYFVTLEIPLRCNNYYNYVCNWFMLANNQLAT